MGALSRRWPPRPPVPRRSTGIGRESGAPCGGGWAPSAALGRDGPAGRPASSRSSPVGSSTSCRSRRRRAVCWNCGFSWRVGFRDAGRAPSTGRRRLLLDDGGQQALDQIDDGLGAGVVNGLDFGARHGKGASRCRRGDLRRYPPPAAQVPPSLLPCLRSSLTSYCRCMNTFE
jgi:hypothetical protein